MTGFETATIACQNATGSWTTSVSAALEELIRRTGRAEGEREMSAARASRAP